MENIVEIGETVCLLGGEEYLLVRNQKAKSGTLYVEARITDENEDVLDLVQIQKRLEERLTRPNQAFCLFGDLLLDKYNATLLLGPQFDYSNLLQSLKVVEYVGPETDVTSFTSNEFHITVQVYQLYRNPPSQDYEGLPQAEITSMPNAKYEGQWDQLVFERDIKGELIWMMTNILRFSQTSNREPGDTHPLILLHGPPGTGKTTLCHGLAQKISIRLNSIYKRTTLVQIKAAALLSKYYSESAKQVDLIFTTLQSLCESDPEEFICVLIDEVETIAVSRESSIQGEAQESLRATNALLTGLDRMKSFPNIVFLCTSNMFQSLDTAFLDRCGLKLSIEPPSIPSQYSILRGRIQRLITRRIILSDAIMPSYREAELEQLINDDLPGSKLLHILELRNSGTEERTSGRSIAQLPEQALLRYLRGEDCDLNKALELIEQYMMTELKNEGSTKGLDISSEDSHLDGLLLGPRIGFLKRRAQTDEDQDTEYALEAMEELIIAMRGRYKRRRVD